MKKLIIISGLFLVSFATFATVIYNNDCCEKDEVCCTPRSECCTR